MERAHDGAIRIVRFDAKRAMANVNGHRVVPVVLSGLRIKREAVEGLHHLPHRFLEGDVTGRFPELLASPEPLLFSGGHRSFAEGSVEEGYQAAHEQFDFRVPGQERLTEPVAPGRASPPGRDAGLLFQHPGFEESVEVRPHGGWMNPEQAGQFRNFPGPLAERLHDGQAAGVPEQAVALGPHSLGKTAVHVQLTTLSKAAARKSTPT